MKQKNLILMVVAVGCGLLAAFLTSQMSARPAATVTQIEVLVVAKELPPGTKFTLDSIKDQFKKKMISQEAVPEKAAITEEALDGKTLNKTLRADDFVRESDLGNYTPLDPPEGKNVISVRIPVDKMTPFVQPNSKVDIMATGMTRDQKVKSTILIPNVLVMAIDTKVNTPSGNAVGDLAIQLATIAVTTDEAMAIRVAEQAQLKLSFILRSETGSRVVSKEETAWSLSKVINWINGDDATVPSEQAKNPPPEPKEPTTTLSVPLTDLPAGTELTPAVLETKFKDVKWLGAAPENAVKNIKAHAGHFLLKDVAANNFVPESYVGDKLPEVAEAPKGKAGDGSSPQPKADLPEQKKLPTFDRTFTTTTGTKMYRYEIQESGEWKLLGEVSADGSIVPVAGNAAPSPGTPKPEKTEPAPKRDI